MRRGGGGGGDPIIKPIGVMMCFLAVLSAGAHKTGQSQISCALLTGLLFGWAQLDARPFPDDADAARKFDPYISAEIIHSLIELGNVFVLFFAGLSVDVSSFRVYWRQIVVVASGYALFSTALFGLFAWAMGLCVGIGSVTFFGICCSLSSKQLMVDHLIRHSQYKTLHSKILQGIALFQDAIAVLAMALLTAFQHVMLDLGTPDTHGSRETAMANLLLNSTGTHPANMSGFGNASRSVVHAAGPGAPLSWKRLQQTRRGSADAGAAADMFEPTANLWHDRFTLGDEICKQLLLTVLVGLVFTVLNKTCLDRVFRFFTMDGEMLFIGTMAYNLGASAICSQVGFSPMIGSYFAGFSLSCLPYRHQIEHKISSLRGYGMTTFYFLLGIYVQLRYTSAFSAFIVHRPLCNSCAH